MSTMRTVNNSTKRGFEICLTTMNSVTISFGMRNVAQELVDKIIDNLKDCHWTLRICSLVCWSWVPTCQRHLFRRIRLLPPCDRHCKRPSDVPYSKRLYEVLLRSPHLANYIQALYIYEGQPMREQDWIRFPCCWTSSQSWRG